MTLSRMESLVLNEGAAKLSGTRIVVLYDQQGPWDSAPYVLSGLVDAQGKRHEANGRYPDMQTIGRVLNQFGISVHDRKWV